MEPLWSATNNTLYSSLINVPPGAVAVLFATGLQSEAYRSTDSIKRPQIVCVQRVLFGFDTPSTPGFTPCVYDVDMLRGKEIVAEFVMTCGKPWQMSKKRNIAVIPLPGIYRLQLNDSTAIGEAQVYVELYSVNDIPPQSLSLFFD